MLPVLIRFSSLKMHSLKDYQTDTFMQVMDKAVAELAPRIVLMGQTSLGRDLAPRLAFKLGVAAVMDCLELAIDPASKAMNCTRPVYGGNARAIFTTEGLPQIATVRQKAGTPLAPDAGRAGEISHRWPYLWTHPKYVSKCLRQSKKKSPVLR